MKFEELKRVLMSGKVSKNYLITGKDVFLGDNAYRLIFESLHIEMPELNEIKYTDIEIDFASVVNALNTPAVFSDNKIVLVDLTTKSTKLKNVDSFKQYIKDGIFDNTLVVRIGENAELTKTFDLKGFAEIDCGVISRDIAMKLVSAEVKKHSKTISVDAINNLLDFTNMDLQACMNEILKLVNFVQAEIKVSDIQDLVSKTLEYKIFELTEALGKKNVEKVYEILADLKHKKTGCQGLIGLIYSHFRRLLHLAITKLSLAEYADLFGVKEYAIKKSMEQVRLFTPKKLKQINDLCMQLEYQLKTSQITSVNAVDMLVLQILQ